MVCSCAFVAAENLLRDARLSTPEMVANQKHDSRCDVWGLGVLMYEFLVGKPPFEDNSKKVTYKKIQNVDLSFPEVLQLSVESMELISSMLQAKPEDRIRLQE